MSSDQQKLIVQKRRVSQRRWMRIQYLQILPGAIQNVLEPAPFIFDDRLDHWLESCYSSASGLGIEKIVVPSRYRFSEFSWPKQILEALPSFLDRYDLEPAYFAPYGVPETGMVLESVPLFEVEFGWARMHLPILFEKSGSGIHLTTKSLSAGIQIHIVCGYLEIDPNPNEKIYQLATWGE